MRRIARPWLVVLLCLATFFNGVAAAAVTPAVSAGHPPCDMSADTGEGYAPCGDCGDSNAACVLQCAALSIGPLLPRPEFSLAQNVHSERVAVGAAALFDSHAGPPGFQPPR